MRKDGMSLGVESSLNSNIRVAHAIRTRYDKPLTAGASRHVILKCY